MIPILLTCVAIDGDTLKCGGVNHRLLAIDAPEKPGHCRQGRTCAPGDPVASQRALQAMVDGQGVEIEHHGKDRYGRPLVIARVKGRNLSCAMILAGRAQYVAKWDMRGMVRRECHEAAEQHRTGER